MSVLDDPAGVLGLMHSPGKAAAMDWAQRTREDMGKGRTADQAAMIAAANVFPAEFKGVSYTPAPVFLALALHRRRRRATTHRCP
jgi:hypothetical protein